MPCWPPPADVNECETGVHRCGEGQVCHNLPGSYRCDCKPGFQRDAFGRTCIGRWGWWLGRAPSSARLPQAPASLALTTCLALSGRVCPAEAPLTVPVALVSCFSAVSVRASLRLPTVPRLLPALILPPPSLLWVPGSLLCPGLGWGLASRLLCPPEPPHLPPADVNECWTSPTRLCQHTCENTLGSYRCSCASGFLLAADGKHCEGTAAPHPPAHPESPASATRRFLQEPPSQSGGRLCCLRAQRWEFPRVQGWQPSFCPLVGSGPGHHCGALGSGEGAK